MFVKEPFSEKLPTHVGHVSLLYQIVLEMLFRHVEPSIGGFVKMTYISFF